MTDPATDAATDAGEPSTGERARQRAVQTARLPEAEALADLARGHALRGEWDEAASLWRRAGHLVRGLPFGTRCRAEAFCAGQLAREGTEEIAFDRAALRSLCGLPID